MVIKILIKTLVNLVEYDNILNTPKFDDDPKVKMEDICNKETKFSTLCYAEPHIKTIDLSIYFNKKEHHFNLKEEDSLFLIKLKKI